METANRPVKDLSDVVAKEIRVLLVRRDMKQTELAAKLGVSEMWLSRRLRGAQPLDLNDLQRIAAVLNVEAADLLRSSEGRTVVVGGEPRRSTTVANHTLGKRPKLTGHPKPFAPHDSTRRPVRLSPAAA